MSEPTSNIHSVDELQELVAHKKHIEELKNEYLEFMKVAPNFDPNATINLLNSTWRGYPIRELFGLKI